MLQIGPPKITPIRGIPLPGFDENRVPVVLVTGDSEVRTAWDRRSVLLGYNLVCNPLPCRLVPRRETTV